MPLPLLRVAVAAGLLFSHAPAKAQDDPGKAVMEAAASLSIGYGGWLWEKKCKTLTPAQGADYDAVVTEALKRLRDASDDRIFNATIGAGRDTSTDPKFSACDGPDSKGFATFGLETARDALAKLRTVPAGYRLTIKD
jgi:hypothetical protein